MKRSAEMLSTHDTLAVFEGVRAHRCMGRTALCPNRCGHSGKLAVFKVRAYLAYEKPGKYGDPKAKQYQFMLEDNLGVSKVSKEIYETVKALPPQQLVHLSWQHDYVTYTDTVKGTRSKGPERTIKTLIKITEEEARKLSAGADASGRPDLTVKGTVPAALDSFDGVAHVMVYENDPMLADASAKRIAEQDLPVKHSAGTDTPVKAPFARIETRERRQYYTVINIYKTADKRQRVMGTGEFGKIYADGKKPETRALKLVPVSK